MISMYYWAHILRKLVLEALITAQLDIVHTSPKVLNCMWIEHLWVPSILEWVSLLARNKSIAVLFLRNGWSMNQWTLLVLNLTHLLRQLYLAKELSIVVTERLAWQSSLLRCSVRARYVSLGRYFKHQPILRLLVREWIFSNTNISQWYHML